jgi:hypothetical protein
MQLLVQQSNFGGQGWLQLTEPGWNVDAAVNHSQNDD